MANLIDASFFIGEINIPNTSKIEVSESLAVFINRYETELMVQLLGYELWSLYDTDATSSRFTDLINGTSYNYGASYWRGLVWGTSPNKHSLIANYIYWYWMKEKETWNSGIGTIRATPNQAVNVSPGIKMVHVWNEFSDQVYRLADYMAYSLDIYPEWSPYSFWQFKHTNDFDI